jgi:hypothetical protein
VTTLFVDDAGIWRYDQGEPDLGMCWEAIVSVTLHKTHDGTQVVLALEFDDAHGEVFVITDRLHGFDEVTTAAAAQLEAFGDNLRAADASTTTLDDPRQIWQRE